MTQEETKLKRIEYLQGILHKYTQTEPKLSLKEIAFALVWELGDVTDLIKEVRKEVKKG